MHSNRRTAAHKRQKWIVQKTHVFILVKAQGLLCADTQSCWHNHLKAHIYPTCSFLLSLPISGRQQPLTWPLCTPTLLFTWWKNPQTSNTRPLAKRTHLPTACVTAQHKGSCKVVLMLLCAVHVWCNTMSLLRSTNAYLKCWHEHTHACTHIYTHTHGTQEPQVQSVEQLLLMHIEMSSSLNWAWGLLMLIYCMVPHLWYYLKCVIKKKVCL